MNKENTYTVYKHIIPSEITGYDFDKYYIGVTKNDVKKRWGSQGCGYKKHNILFYKAIKNMVGII